jgi:hypothetical protein
MKKIIFLVLGILILQSGIFFIILVLFKRNTKSENKAIDIIKNPVLISEATKHRLSPKSIKTEKRMRVSMLHIFRKAQAALLSLPNFLVKNDKGSPLLVFTLTEEKILPQNLI